MLQADFLLFPKKNGDKVKNEEGPYKDKKKIRVKHSSKASSQR